MEQNDRNGRDAAGVGPYARERERLVPLSTLDAWSVSDGEPDIRGWEIHTVSGRQLGAVHDLLIDAKAGEVVMLDVDLPGTDKHTFVPIRVAQIDRERRIVLMDSADLPQSNVARTAATVAPVVEPGAGTIRYPDREIVRDRALADSARADDLPPEDVDSAPMVDRRRGDRRKIDRLSTDL